MSMDLYPLKFKPIFKEKLWGGQKIKTILGKDFGGLANCGETWELSGVEGNISEVAEGPLAGQKLTQLIEDHKEDLVGQKVLEHFGLEFPLLIKFIDAAEDLSIQVHPDDELAKSRHNGFGKTEMWYIIQADEGSQLISGFNRQVSREDYLKYFNNGQLEDILNKEIVHERDVFFLPAGRVHTIGKGLLLAEIQQTSDITYRIYDFDRVDNDGNKRELHVEEALDAIDYNFYPDYKNHYPSEMNQSNEVISTKYFTTNKLNFDQRAQLDRSSIDCFKIYIGVNGQGTIAGESIKLGEVILVPACMKHYNIEPKGSLELLESYIEL